jgi:hypothetical protein
VGDAEGQFAVPSHVLVQQLPEQGLLFLDLTTEEYFGLDAVGTAMYEAILSAGTLEAACDRMLSEYEVSREKLLADMRSFVDAMLERKLIVEQSS